VIEISSWSFCFGLSLNGFKTFTDPKVYATDLNGVLTPPLTGNSTPLAGYSTTWTRALSGPVLFGV
jgi:hypothetical protein